MNKLFLYFKINAHTIPETEALPKTSWNACLTPATFTSLTDVTIICLSPPDTEA